MDFNVLEQVSLFKNKSTIYLKYLSQMNNEVENELLNVSPEDIFTPQQAHTIALQSTSIAHVFLWLCMRSFGFRGSVSLIVFYCIWSMVVYSVGLCCFLYSQMPQQIWLRPLHNVEQIFHELYNWPKTKWLACLNCGCIYLLLHFVIGICIHFCVRFFSVKSI